MITVVEGKDRETGGHILRTREYVMVLAQYLGIYFLKLYFIYLIYNFYVRHLFKSQNGGLNGNKQDKSSF